MVKVPLFDNQEPSELPILTQCEGFDGPCKNVEAEWTWMTTYYPDACSNWRYLCAECAEWALEYWNEIWREYWSSQGFYISTPLPTEHIDKFLGSNYD